MLRRSNPVLSLIFTSVEPTPADSVASARPQLFTNQGWRGQPRTTGIVTFVLLVAFLFVAAGSEARADVFNQNQRLKNGTSPAVVQWDYDITPNPTPPVVIPVGSVVHIVYGIGVPAGNPNPVSVAITLPSGFTQTAIRCLKFSGPTGPPVAGGSLPTANCTAASVTVGAMSLANDKVIVIFDGFFSQAGAYSASFVPSGGALGTGAEPKTLNMNADILNLPVDIGITKEVKKKVAGVYASTATVSIAPPAGGLTYKLRITNNSPVDNTYHSTDVYLGKLLRLDDTLSTPPGPIQDVFLNITLQNFQCAKSSTPVDCPAMPGTWSPSLGPWNSWNLPTITYPTTSNGFLPAGGWFEITFDAVISTTSPCSPHQNNKLNNVASFSYSNGTTTVSDTNPANNTSVVTTANLQVSGLPTVCPPPLGILVTKAVLIPGSWGTPFTYKITITNTNSVTLTGLTLNDLVTSSSATPAFTATPSSVNCTPACAGAPVLYTPIVNPGWQAVLFNASFQPLAPNATQTVQYQVVYNAPCAVAPATGSISNTAWVNGPVSGSAVVTNAMPPRPLCPFQVTKAQTSGPMSFASFPATFGYQVVFKNTSPTQTHNVRTLVDSIALDSANYGNVPITYSYACTASGVTGVTPLIVGSTSATMQYNNPVWAGVRLIDLSSPAGAVFSPGGTLTCNVSVTLQQPPTNDSKCQGAGNPSFVNSAFMDTSYPFNTNQAQPVFYAKVIRPLPKCVSIVVGKSPSPNVIAGGPMTFTLTVKNAGNDPTPAGIKLLDNVPGSFTVTGWNCAPAGACTPSAGGAGNNIIANLNPIAGGATTTVLVTATAPSVAGAYCNTDNATFNPFPPLTFFEGNQSALTTASACVQVSPPPPSPPKLTKTFSPSVINLGQPVNVIFTITNPAGQGAQTGLTFADALPSPPFTTSTVISNTCNGTPLANGHILILMNGSLPAGPSTCTVAFQMAPPKACGVFQNNKGNIHDSKGLNFTDVNAALTVRCGEPVEGEIMKVALGVPANFAGQFQFNVSCTPPGGAPATSVETLTFNAADPLSPYKGGLKAKIKTIPVGLLAPGTVCTVTEVMPLPPPPPGCSWLPPTYSPANGTVTATAPGPVKVTVLNRLSCDKTDGTVLPNKKPTLEAPPGRPNPVKRPNN